MHFWFIIALLISNTTFAQDTQNIKTKDSTFGFAAKLTDNTALTPGCGYFAFAVAKKFKITESDNAALVNKDVTIIIQCPESYGAGFFVTDRTYILKVGMNNNAPFGWLIRPGDYQKNKLLVFWVRGIRHLKEQVGSNTISK